MATAREAATDSAASDATTLKSPAVVRSTTAKPTAAHASAHSSTVKPAAMASAMKSSATAKAATTMSTPSTVTTARARRKGATERETGCHPHGRHTDSQRPQSLPHGEILIMRLKLVPCDILHASCARQWECANYELFIAAPTR
jgi:hypothetical protein